MSDTSGQWILLAAAICKSGIECYDEDFLKSKWYDNLRAAVEGYIQDQNEHLNKNAWRKSEFIQTSN